jgi:hypothetical protein
VGEAEFARRAEARIAAHKGDLPHGESTLIEAEARAILAADRAAQGMPEPLSTSIVDMSEFDAARARLDAPDVLELDVPTLVDDVPPRTVPMPAEPDLGRLAKDMETAQAAKAEFAAHLEQGGTLESFLAKRKLPDPVRNLLIGLHEAGDDPRRVTALTRQAAEKAKGPKSARDATADAVEGMRSLTEEQLANIDKPAPKSVDPLMDSVQRRVAELEALAPDTTIRLDENGEPVPLAKELKRIRAEALDGTDQQLGIRDVDLLQVAADCALSGG